MPMHSDRSKRRRRRKREYRALDWFSEDPWADPISGTSDSDDEEWSLDSWGAEEEELDLFEDPYGGWGPVRSRRKRQSHAP